MRAVVGRGGAGGGAPGAGPAERGAQRPARGNAFLVDGRVRSATGAMRCSASVRLAAGAAVPGANVFGKTR
ncbi:hypothetical protein CEQ11_012625 [Micrococcus sp. FDAARGOS_333]|nr:hypothetical protein CEQ11_012625 [Micrococcus sp. FDAARGOS_333]